MTDLQTRKKLIGITNRLVLGADPVPFADGYIEAYLTYGRKAYRFVTDDGQSIPFASRRGAIAARDKLIAYFCGDAA